MKKIYGPRQWVEMIGVPVLALCLNSCGGCNPMGSNSNSPTASSPQVKVVATNNTPYAVSMDIDGAAYVGIAAGKNYTFTSYVSGSHVFSMAAIANMQINANACDTAYTCTSNHLYTSTQYPIDIEWTNTGGCGSGTITWACPQDVALGAGRK